MAVFVSKSENIDVFSQGENLTVIMYHSILEEGKKSSDYIITVNQLEKDLSWLIDHGYNPVTCLELIKYTNSEGDLPPNPILITFDDGMYNNMSVGLPILEKYGFSAVFSIVGSYAQEYSLNNIKNTDYSYLSWDDISILSENPHVELANHSYNLHSIGQRYGTQIKKNEKFSEYLKVFYKDTQKMQDDFFSNCTINPVIYTYPFGGFCKDSERILKKNGFLVTFSCIEGINKITRNPECLYLLKRFNRSGKLSTEEFFSKIKL